VARFQASTRVAVSPSLLRSYGMTHRIAITRSLSLSLLLERVSGVSLFLVASSCSLGAPSSFLLLVVRPGATSSVLVTSRKARSAPSSVLTPSSDAQEGQVARED